MSTTCARLSICANKLGGFQTAVELATRVVEENSDIPKHEEAVLDAYLTMGISLAFLGQLDDSLEMCDRAEDILHTLDPDLRKNRARKASVLFNRGTTLLFKGETETGIEFLSMSYPLFEEVGNIRRAGW